MGCGLEEKGGTERRPVCTGAPTKKSGESGVQRRRAALGGCALLLPYYTYNPLCCKSCT